MKRYFNEATIAYLRLHKGLWEEIIKEAKIWCKQSSREARHATLTHFAEEIILVEGVKSGDAQTELSALSATRKRYASLPSVTENNEGAVDLDYFETQAEQLFQDKGTEHFDSDSEALHYSLSKALSDSLATRQAAFEQILIDESRRKYLDELYKRIDTFKKLESALKPLLDFFDTGTLWDISSGTFAHYGFDALRYYSKIIKNEKTITELAKLLGRQSVASREIELAMIEQTVVKSAFHPRSATSGDLVGFEYSGDINRVIPTELGGLNNPETEELFYAKLIERKLWSYKYITHESIQYCETKTLHSTKEKNEPCGPIIACVDTSGSMAGAPEITAKTLLLSIAKEAIATKRNCYIISFSNRIETLDISDFKSGNALQTLVSFLNKSFNGGTDAYPALCEVVKVLQESNYKNTDLIMVSDFIMPSLPQNIVTSIEQEKANGTLFYSFVIGRSANMGAVKAFNETILYDPYSEEGRKAFARQIKQIAKRKHDIISA